jgi:glucose dehydrogenase
VHQSFFTPAICLMIAIPAYSQARSDWPMFGHDSASTRFSPLNRITPKNIGKLRLAWSFETTAEMTDSARPITATSARPTQGRPRVRQSKTTPIVVGDVMFLSTPYNRVVALNAESGAKIWEYVLPFSPASRGISYWPGSGGDAPRIFIGTASGRLIALDAGSGKLVPQFGENGILDVRAGVADKFPKAHYGISSPPAIYKDIVITGCQLQEMPSKGPSGDVRGWDVRSGKLVWTFHTLPRPGEPNHETWQEDQWQDKSGLNAWGLITVDETSGIAFLPLGTPTTDFYGGDRKGTNLYGSSIVAVDAASGKLQWYFQTSHHDNWDYDVTAAPVLLEIKRGRRNVPAVAQSTKQGLLFILDRRTGKPLFDVEERPVATDNIPPGDEPSRTQPFPVKPAPLSLNHFEGTEAELANLTPEHDRMCKDLLSLEGGVMMGGPYAEYGPKLRIVFPGWTGGGNWGGTAYDPKRGLLFINTKSEGMLSKLVKEEDGSYSRVGPDTPPPGVKDVFQVGPWPCQAPPWGELSAVNVNTGDIVWRIPLGSFPELDAMGIPTTGRTNVGGPIATAGGLVFIAATEDQKFRAFDSKTGKKLWETTLNSNGSAVPITYKGKSGKQYVAVVSNGASGEKPQPPTVYVYALP